MHSPSLRNNWRFGATFESIMKRPFSEIGEGRLALSLIVGLTWLPVVDSNYQPFG